MSSVTQIPVYKTVCIATEERVVGYRDLTPEEALQEELFSSNVPDITADYGLDEQILVETFTPPTMPGTYVPVPRPVIDPLPTPLPGAALLFSSVFLIYVLSRIGKLRA